MCKFVPVYYKRKNGRRRRIRVAVREQAPQTGEAMPPGSHVALAAPS